MPKEETEKARPISEAEAVKKEVDDLKGDIFDEVFGADSEEMEARKKAVEKLKEKKGEKKEAQKEAVETTVVPNASEKSKRPMEKTRTRRPTEESPAEKETVEAPEMRKAIGKLLLRKAKKSAEEEETSTEKPKEAADDEALDEDSAALHEFLEKEVVEEFDPDKEQDTKEKGAKSLAIEQPAEAETEVASEEAQLARSSEVQLRFLEDKAKRLAFIGRKKSVFKEYGDEAALFIGRVSEQEFKDRPVCLDSLNPHVVFVCGSRGSGKSYVMGVIAEELALKNQNVGTIVIDPVGVFWSMKLPNREEKEISLLAKWELLPQGLSNMKVFIPAGVAKEVPKATFDDTFSMQPSLLTVEDWCLTFGIERFSPTGLLLEKAIAKVQGGYTNSEGKTIRARSGNFSLEELIICLETDADITGKDRGYKQDTIRALTSRLEAAKAWGVFDAKGTPLAELSSAGQLTIIDTSFLEDNVSALVIGILARRILAARKKQTRKEAAGRLDEKSADSLLEFDIPPTWLFIDEAHTLIPSGNIKTPATAALVEYVKQGRRPGCSLVFATQQPSAIDPKVLSQLDILIAHKLIFDDDIKAIQKRTPTIIPARYRQPNFIKTIPVGVGLVADRREETSRAFVMQVRPRMSQHEGRDAEATSFATTLSLEQVERLAVEMSWAKLQKEGMLETQTIKSIVATLNSKYKSKVKAEGVVEALKKKGALQSAETIALPLAKKEKITKDIAGEKEALTKTSAEGQAPAEQLETIELVAFPLRVSQKDAERIAGSKARRKAFGLLGGEKLKEVRLKHQPIYRIKYDVLVGKNEFVARECFVNSISGEFIHFGKNNFFESLGAARLFGAREEEILVLQELLAKRLKQEKADAKTKRVLESLAEKGLVEKKIDEKRDKTVFQAAKGIELPPSPTHGLLSSINNVPFIKTEAVEIEREKFSLLQVQELVKKMFPNILVKKTETIYRPVFEAVLEEGDKRRIVCLDAVTGKEL